MRFKTLHIENLASLKGKHKIDFSNKDLFAITGPTGSGKSTILNAITLALYGELYKKSLHQNDLISLNTTFAQVYLTFDFEGSSYEAHWSARLAKKSGEPLKNPIYKRKLKCQDQLLELGAAELFGLTFSEFCQTIVLHQGEFSKFLISSPGEKRQLLEKIFKMSHYSSFATQVRATLRELDYEKRILINGLSQLPENLIESLANSQKKNKTQTEKIGLKRISLEEDRKFIQLYEKSLQIKNLYLQKEKELSALEEKTKAIEIKFCQQKDSLQLSTNNFQRLEKRNRPEIQRLISLQVKQKELIQLNKYLDKTTHSLEKDTLSYETKEKNLALLVSQRSDINKELESLPSLEINHLDLKKVEQDYHFHFKEESLKSLNDSCQGQERQLISLKNQINQIWQERKVYSNIAKSSQETTQRLARFEKVIIALKTKQQLYQNKKQEYEKEKLNSQKIQLKQQNLITEKEALSLQQKEMTEQLFLLSELAQSKLAFKEESLKDGQCHLCETDLSEQNKKSFQKEILLNKTLLEKKSALMEKDLELTDSLQKIEKHLFHFHHQMTLMKNAVLPKKPLTLSIFQHSLNDEYSSLKNQLQLNKIKAQEKAVLTRKIFDFLRSARSLKHQLKISTTKLTTADAFLNKVIAQWKIIDIHDHLLKDHLVQTQLRTQLLKTSLLDQAINIDEKILELTKENKAQQVALKERTDQLLKEKRSLSQKFLELEEIDFTQIKIMENKIKDSHLQLEQIKKDFSYQQNILTENQSRIKEIKKHIQGLKEQFDSQSLDHSKLQNKSFDEFVNTFHEDEKGLESLIKENIQLLEEMKYFKQKKSHFEKLHKEKEAITELERRQKNLYLAMDGDGFRQYALSHLEEKLLYKTNAELKTLCQGRYELALNETGKDYLLVDRFMGSQMRKIATLSGGEIFLVSLCMALGLSEMAKGSNHLESFFIDEGFGTLDDSCLEKIFDTLHELSLRGKQVGIISHIDKLTNWLPSRIQLNKNSHGHVEIESVAN